MLIAIIITTVVLSIILGAFALSIILVSYKASSTNKATNNEPIAPTKQLTESSSETPSTPDATETTADDDCNCRCTYSDSPRSTDYKPYDPWDDGVPPWLL